MRSPSTAVFGFRARGRSHSAAYIDIGDRFRRARRAVVANA
jgi:hypothetical protein